MKLKEFEIGENLTWILITAMLIIGGTVVELSNPGILTDDNYEKEKCVIVSIEKVHTLKGFNNTAKVKFEDGVIEIKKIDGHLVAGDTILIER